MYCINVIVVFVNAGETDNIYQSSLKQAFATALGVPVSEVRRLQTKAQTDHPTTIEAIVTVHAHGHDFETYGKPVSFLPPVAML